MKTLFLSCVFLLLVCPSVVAQEVFPTEVETDALVEFTLQARESYPNETALHVWATFEHEGGVTERVLAFWDGEDVWKIRFKPSLPGTWQWSTQSEEPSDSGLHDRVGALEVTDGDGHLERLRVAESNRTLETQGGEPFYWLGDTAWEITWKSRREQVEAYMDDRQAKGFNVLQIVTMSHQFFYPDGVSNRYGESYFLDGTFDRLNPRYFDYLDEIVEMANERGMRVALVPLWAYMMELHHIPEYHQYTISIAQSMRIADYIGARYAGHDVVWIVGGDNAYTTPSQLDFWNVWAQRLKEASGGWHLMTVHPRGFNASFDYFDSDTPWLDFHMYQSSHVAGGDYTWQAAQRGRDLRPVKPVVNGEPNYEDIYHNLWEPGDTIHVETFRIRPEHVRQAAWESLLSGATMGVTYGGNGVWQWNTEEQPGSHNPRLFVEEAWQMPGSAQMGVMRDVAESLEWFSFEPADDLLLAAEAGEHVALARNGKGILLYLPTNSQSVTLDLFVIGANAMYRWIDPSTGDSQEPQRVDSGQVGMARTFLAPSSNDWLLYVYPENILTEPVPTELPDRFVIHPSFPNPFNPSTRIVFELPEPGDVRVDVYSADGRHIRTIVDGARPAGIHTAIFEATGLSSGLYLARVQTSSGVGTVKMLYLK